MQTELNLDTPHSRDATTPWLQPVNEPRRRAEGKAANRRAAGGRPRVLHCVGHLLRGGIEMGLFNLLTSHNASQCDHHVLVRTAEEEPFTGAFREAGIPVHSCINYRNPIRYAIELRRLVQRHGPYDILHVHGSSFSGLLTLFFAKWCGIRWTIVHSHNDVRPTLNELGMLHRAYIRFVMSIYRTLADSGFAASVLAAESMFGMNWTSDPRWELLYFGIDCRPFKLASDPKLRATLGIDASARVIGHVGRFHEQKNHAFLVNMVQVAIEKDINVVCLCIGDGPLREQILDEVHRRCLDEHFVFVPDSLSVPALMISVMDCFVFPSRYEGLGLVVVEAQAAGLPCVISDRVPSEAIVNQSLVTVMPLETSPTQWASEILRQMSGQFHNRNSEAIHRVESSRFNLEACASALWERYAQFSQQYLDDRGTA